ncbi:very short patch repair endonuclease [Mycobacteroides chelonae]|nr:very short patch repair endonuclease [Mycobacteroides chelonae]QQG95025.1 very short patch repair endonuclease [Mycobacteroides chelonae]
MRGNRSRDTKPELAVRCLLHSCGLRFRVDYRPVAAIPRRADIVFTRARIAVFIDGCFWHGCPEHHVPAKSNTQYWGSKIRRNRARDSETTYLLRRSGWTVLRYWSHEPAEYVAADICERYRNTTAQLS